MLAILVLVTFIAFQPALYNDFVDWDDEQNLVHNEAYRGFAWENLRWMFTTCQGGHYHPLTWLSWAADYAIWGLGPAGFHLTNIILHSLTAIGLYYVTRELLRAAFYGPHVMKPGPSAPLAEDSVREDAALRLASMGGALVYAIHPLRVESVAWATERRDVLSGALLMLTVYLYLRAAHPEHDRRRSGLLAVSLLCYVLSLLSKAAGMVLPAVLLVLDLYPLRRVGPFAATDARERHATRNRVVLEKLLYLIPALAITLLAAWAQREAGAMRSFEEHPLSLRIGQAFYGIMFYLWKTLMPTLLIALYEQDPQATPFDPMNVIGAIVTLGLTTLLVARWRRWPAALAAWLVYLIFLAPVLGLAQSGPQVVADRYTYLSCMPWFVLLAAWFYANWRGRAWGDLRRGAIYLVGLVLITYNVVTRGQVRTWADSQTLWEHVIYHAPDTGIAHSHLAGIWNERGEYELGRKHALRTLEILPGNRVGHVTLARASLELGDLDTAVKHYQIALEISANMGEVDASSLLGLADAYTRLGRFDDAEQMHLKILEAEPEVAECHMNYGGFLISRARYSEARTHLETALRLDPDLVEAYHRLGYALWELGDQEQAVRTWEAGLTRDPTHITIRARLAYALATAQDDAVRDGPRALELARAAVADSAGRNFLAREALAAAYAATGDFDQAHAEASSALQDFAATLQPDSAERLQSAIAAYAQRRPWRN